MLVDLQTAKSWLRISGDDDDCLVQIMCDQASMMVIDYIKRPDHGWTAETVPAHVQAVLFHILSRLNDDRDGKLPGGPFPDHIKSLLDRDRDPALA